MRLTVKIRKILTLLRYPILSIQLRKKGAKGFIIGKRLNINRLRYIDAKDDFAIGYDCRFTFIDNYAGKKHKPHLSIGYAVSVANRFSVLVADDVHIGNRVLIASDVSIISHNHGMDPKSNDTYADNELITSPVFIADGVWLGEKVIVLPGVSLGRKCIVAAGSIVTQSFPEYTMIAGVPAKPIKKYNVASGKWERYEQEL